MTIHEQLRDYADDGKRAYPLIDSMFDVIIATLRRDPHLRSLTAFELELLLADARADAGATLFHELRGRIHIDDLGDIL